MGRMPGGLTAIFKPKKCEYCGKSFIPKSGRARFCGKICREKKYEEADK